MRLSLLVIASVLLAQAAHAGPNCKCRFNGTTYKLGEIACIRGKLSQCELNLNNTSWKTLADECPQARNYTPKPERFEIARVAKMSFISQ